MAAAASLLLLLLRDQCLLDCCGLQMGLNPNAPSEARKVKKIVQQMDSDGSGALDFDEFWAWWREHLGERMAL